jgi:hypothetical protein
MCHFFFYVNKCPSLQFLYFFMSVKIRTGPGVESVNIEGFMFLLDLDQFQPKTRTIN